MILLGTDQGIQGGDLVVGEGQPLRVPVGPHLLGRVVNALGQPLDESGPIEATGRRPLEQKAPGIIARQPVDEPLHTGLKVVDALVPIGRGQRELILGDRQTGKTTIAVDTILNQTNGDVRCIYVAVGQKKSTTLGVIGVPAFTEQLWDYFQKNYSKLWLRLQQGDEIEEALQATLLEKIAQFRARWNEGPTDG